MSHDGIWQNLREPMFIELFSVIFLSENVWIWIALYLYGFDWCKVINGWGNGLASNINQQLPEPVKTKVYDAKWCH